MCLPRNEEQGGCCFSSDFREHGLTSPKLGVLEIECKRSGGSRELCLLERTACYAECNGEAISRTKFSWKDARPCAPGSRRPSPTHFVTQAFPRRSSNVFRKKHHSIPVLWSAFWEGDCCRIG